MKSVFDEVMLKRPSIIDQMLFLIWFQGHAKIRKKEHSIARRCKRKREYKEWGRGDGEIKNDLISLLDLEMANSVKNR